jgi:hypothetical protein
MQEEIATELVNFTLIFGRKTEITIKRQEEELSSSCLPFSLEQATYVL